MEMGSAGRRGSAPRWYASILARLSKFQASLRDAIHRPWGTRGLKPPATIVCVALRRRLGRGATVDGSRGFQPPGILERTPGAEVPGNHRASRCDAGWGAERR